jgi:Integrase core domain
LLRLELHACEHARAVLRGGGGSNVVSLPDYLHDYANPRQARSGLGSYFDFYNYRRVHQSLDYRTPAEVYFQTASARQKRTTVIESTLTTKGEESTLNKTLYLS